MRNFKAANKKKICDFEFNVWHCKSYNKYFTIRVSKQKRNAECVISGRGALLNDLKDVALHEIMNPLNGRLLDHGVGEITVIGH